MRGMLGGNDCAGLLRSGLLFLLLLLIFDVGFIFVLLKWAQMIAEESTWTKRLTRCARAYLAQTLHNICSTYS